MFTFHHGFWIYFITRKHSQVWQFVLGSMLPDYAYLAMAVSLVWTDVMPISELLSLSPILFMTYVPLYPWVAQYDLLGHSLVVWSIAFIITLFPGMRTIQAFVVGWGTHVFIDALTHAAYTNMLLYPLSRLNIHSPVSYWEQQYFAHEFNLVNSTLMTMAALYLAYEWWRNKFKK